MSKALVDRYIKDLLLTYQYRAANDRARFHPSAGIGSAAPSAMQLAMMAMRSTAPPQTFAAKPAADEPSTLADKLKTAINFVSPATYLIPKAAESGPGKAAIDIISRPAYGVGNTIKKGNERVKSGDPNAADISQDLSNFWEGFTGKAKFLPSDAYEKGGTVDSLGDKGKLGKTAEFIARLGADVAFDPLSYVTGAPVVRAIKAAKARPAAQAAVDVAAEVTPIEGKVMPALEGTKPMLALPAGSVAPSDVRFTAGAAGVTDKINPVSFADETAAAAISDLVKNTPKLEFPALQVDPLFKTVTERSVQRVPQKVTEKVEVPIEPTAVQKAGEAAPVAVNSAQEAKRAANLAEARAIKMTILNTPDYKIAGKYPVRDMLRAIQTTDDAGKRATLTKMIDDEVKQTFKSQDYSKLPGLARLLTSEGATGSVGLTVEQAAKLFREGKVPKVLPNYEKEGAQALVDQFPLHSVEDTTRVFLNNAKGERVSLAQYFSDLGIDLTKVDPETGKALGGKGSVKAKPKAAKPTFGGLEAITGVPQTKTVTRTKTVFTEVVSETTKTARLEKAESVAWALKHTERGLTKKEIAYLRAARTPESFAKRVEELSARTVFGNFETLKDVVEAYKAGMVPEAWFKQLLKITGAKSADDVLEKAAKILKVRKPEPVPTLDDFVTGSENISRSTKIEPSVWDNVEPVDIIIQKVAAGDTSAVAHPIPEIDETVLRDVAAALDESIIKNLVDPQDIKKYPFLSGRVKAKRTARTPGSGKGRNLHGWNKYSQGDTFKAIAVRVSNDVRKEGLKGKELSAYLKVRPELMYSRVMDALNLSEAALRAKGVKLIAGDQNNGILLSLGDVLNALDPKTVKRFLFSRANGAKRGNNIYPTKILDVAEQYVRAAQEGNNLDLVRETARKMLELQGTGERLVKDRGVTEFLASMEEALPRILQRVNANYADESIKIGESVKSMTDKVINDVIRAHADPTVSMGAAFKELIDRADNASAVGRSVQAPTEALPVAKKIIDSELTSPQSGNLRPGDLAEADTAKRFTTAEMGNLGKAAQEQAANEIGAAQQASRASESLRMADPTTDLSDLHDIRLQAGIFRAHAPILDKAYALQDIMGRAFKSNYGHADLHNLVHVEHNVTQSLARMHRGIMQRTFDTAQKVYGTQAKDKLAEAFKMLQEGRTVVDDPAMQAIIADMKGSVDILFLGGPRGNYAARNGLFPDHLNEIMGKYGVPDAYRFDGKGSLADQADVWRAWVDVKDPLDLLDRVHASYQRATMETTIARDFSAQWGKTTKAPGYVKIVDSRGVSAVGKFIDKSLYYPREIVEQLPHLDQFMDNSIFKTGPLMRVYDEVLHMWKAGVTIYRPGHHVRNLIGDVGLSYLAGVSNPKHYKSASRILSGRASAYTADWDAFKALQAGEKGANAKVGRTTTYRIGRKKVSLTDDEIWRAAFNQGLLPDYNILEDTAFNAGQSRMSVGGISIRKPFKGKVQQAAGGISQARDHWVRIAHFTHALEKHGKSAKSMDELFAVAGKEVRKWHPDGSDLTAFERQGMRRIIPFYSWFRKAIPLVVEGFAMRPGRAMVVPKAMYDFAKTMGIDPESLANPFPEDMLLPSWLTDQALGPQWEGGDGNLYGISPGDPVTDLSSGFLSAGAGNDVMGGITPALRMPAELMTDTSFGTGTRIKDKTEYVGQNMPGLSILQNILNKDVLGGMQPTEEVQRGYADNFDQTALINTLTGLSIKNFTKPQYLKSGQLEYRDSLRNK